MSELPRHGTMEGRCQAVWPSGRPAGYSLYQDRMKTSEALTQQCLALEPTSPELDWLLRETQRRRDGGSSVAR